MSWFSNAPWASTGYGVQTKLFTPRIRDLGHEVSIIAFYGNEGAQLVYDRMPVYPRAGHPYGQDVLGAHSADFGADITIIHMDAWVCEPAMFGPRVRAVYYFPIDMEPLPNIIKQKVATGYERVVFSRFGCRMMDDAGLTYQYVPHAVDTTALQPMEQAEARGKLGLPADAFIVGIVAANKGNPSRKALWQQILAFDEFKQKHSDALLYLHMTAGAHGEMGGVNLPEFIQVATSLRLGTDVIFTDQYRLISGLNDEYMKAAFSAFDVLSNVSLGEGFGVTMLEAQACGCPVLTGDWTAQSELCMAGWLVDKADTQRVWTPLAAWQYDPKPSAIAEQMGAAYEARGNRKLRQKARKAALDYDADLVTKQYWKPVLDDLAARVAAEGPKRTFATALAEAADD